MKISLGDLMISPAVWSAWHQICSQVVPGLIAAGVSLKLLGYEQAQALPDGSLEIYVDIDGFGRLSLVVPADQWEARPHSN